MTKPKLNIREMIRSGEIDTAKAGQLVTVNYYTKNGLISDSDERALRETAKDARLYNAYMAGGRELREAEIFLIALSSEAKLGIQKLAWIGAELKYTIETYYQPPRVVALTEEAYERIGKEKRERRLKRTYTLVTLYRILAENLIKYPETKAEEQAVAKLKEDANPKEAETGTCYGIDLIDPDGKGDVIEYWRGWTPYHFYNKKLDTIADLAEELPEAHAYIIERLQAFYKAKKLSIDPESVPLDKYHETELKGSELAGMETDIKLLQDLLNRTEHSLLDAYKDEGEDEQTADNRSIFEKYMQSYAILKTPEAISPYELKDGVIDPNKNTLDRPLSWGYSPDRKEGTVGATMPLETIKNNREAISSNLYILYAFNKWRQKAGELLGVIKADEFKSMTEHLDAKELYHTYEVHRRLLIDQINAQSYILPEYRDYTDEIVSLYQPIGDNSENYNAFLNAPIKDSEAKKLDPVGDIFKANKYVTKALEHIEGVTIHSLADSFYELRDILQPILDSKHKTLEKQDNE
jgi:hypothetical protein